jgi:hypothetical protein
MRSGGLSVLGHASVASNAALFEGEWELEGSNRVAEDTSALRYRYRGNATLTTNGSSVVMDGRYEIVAGAEVGTPPRHLRGIG